MTRLARQSVSLLLAVLLPAGQIYATQLPRSAVQLATDAAVRGLKDQVDRLPLGRKITVGAYLDTIQGHEFILANLQRAQLIGGPRVLGDNTVQVRLDISGKIVADALAQIAAVNARKSPYTPEFVARESRAWSDRTFTSTGLSTTPPTPPSAPPAPTTPATPPTPAAPTPDSAPSAAQSFAVPRGITVTDAAPPGTTVPSTPPATIDPAVIDPAAIDAAKRSAAQGLLARLAQVQLPAGRTGADLLARPGVTDALTAYLASLPPDSATKDPRGEVTVSLPLDRERLLTLLRSPSPTDDPAWPATRQALLDALPDKVLGVAVPASPPAPQPDRPATVPASTPAAPKAPEPAPRLTISVDRPPAWFQDQMDAGGAAAWSGSKLLTARAAETDALRLLRRQLEALELAPDQRLGDTAARDPLLAQALAQAVDRALDRARVYRVEYMEDSSAAVKISTDLRYLWQDLVDLAPAR